MRLTLSCLLCCVLLLGACTRPSAPAGRAVTDALGRRVEVPERAQRVVSLAPSVTETVFAAGAGDRLVGATRSDDYPAAVQRLPRINTWPVEFERVTALKPDLVLASDQINTTRDADTFAQLGIPVYFLPSGSIQDVLRAIEATGKLLGTEDAARAESAQLRRRIDALRKRSAPADHRPSVLVLISDETLFAFGSESYIHEVIALAGGHSLTANVKERAPVLSDEFVLTHPPDVIVGSMGPGYDARRLLAKRPTWAALPAVKQGRVYGIDPSLVLRPGPRLIDAAEQMADWLHPAAAAAAR